MKKTLFVTALAVALIFAALRALPRFAPIESGQFIVTPSPAIPLPTPTRNPNFVYLEFYSPAGYDINRDPGYELRVGDKVFKVCGISVSDRESKVLGCLLTLAEFASVSDGDAVEVSDYDLPLPGRPFGPLDKSQLQMTEQLPLVIQGAIDGLTTGRDTFTDPAVRARFDAAIQQLTVLLDPIYWLDPIHLQPDQADAFFAEAQRASDMISALPNVPIRAGGNITYFVGAGNAGQVLGVVRSLAAAAYDDSVRAAGGAWNLEALVLLQKGDEVRDFQQSLEYYISAREFALNRTAMLDDAPNVALLVAETSPNNSDLHYYINPEKDEDWFRFTKTLTGTVQVFLDDLPANYDLYVYSASTNGLVGSSKQDGTTAEIVAMAEALPGDYYVQIVGVDNEWNSDHAYTLRFDAPGEPTPTPTPMLTATSTPTPTATPTATPTSTSITLAFYLHGSGAMANPPTLFLDSAAPTGTTAKYRDSASVKFSGGNAWQEIGTWTATPELTAGQLTSLSDLYVWLGLKNSDDIGTRFDLRAEVYKNGVLLTAGESDCITGVTRNADQAKEVVITFATFAPVNFDGVTDGLTLKVMARIGTDGAGAFCGGHSNAVGVRLYFEAVSRAAMFGAP